VVVDDEICPRFCERGGNGATHAASAAGHQSDFSVEFHGGES
jgi:hypothetical protein